MAQQGKPGTPSPITVDGNALVKHLTNAGLDPKKFDIKAMLAGAPGLDVAELESHLRTAGTKSAVEWHVTVTVAVGPRK
ncbi:MAG TPA: hypothetical protein VJA16_16870 [Thermoanaerobaculia bacterium]